jgi:hypothetical protein
MPGLQDPAVTQEAHSWLGAAAAAGFGHVRFGALKKS